MHVPTKFLPSEVGRGPTPLLAIFFLQGPRSSAPGIKLISKAEAAARLFANALNPLAHAGEGLDGAIEIVRRKPCFELTIADPSATVALVNNTVQSLFDETQDLD
jgi:hypothetical protein